jgi:DNA polymerase III epsilon subunit-like protein
MLDLETLGQKPGSVIVAIGVVKFGNGKIIDSFYGRPKDVGL